MPAGLAEEELQCVGRRLESDLGRGGGGAAGSGSPLTSSISSIDRVSSSRCRRVGVRKLEARGLERVVQLRLQQRPALFGRVEQTQHVVAQQEDVRRRGHSPRRCPVSGA